MKKYTTEMNRHISEKEQMDNNVGEMKKSPRSLSIGEIQIKAALKYHLPPEKIVIIKKSNNIKYCGTFWSHSILLVEM